MITIDINIETLYFWMGFSFGFLLMWLLYWFGLKDEKRK